MTISVRIIAPDLVEVAARPSWWERLLRASWSREAWNDRPFGWCWAYSYCDVGADVQHAIARAFADDAARRRAETARNYQAAAQRGEYPLR